MLLLDAIRAEAFKLTRNRWTLFWAFGLAPVATLVIGVADASLARSMNAIIAPASPVRNFLGALATPANMLVQLLLIAGASVMFAGEYRWQTWRAIVPRSRRSALIGAKFLVFAGFASASMIACAAMGFVVANYEQVVLHVPATWPRQGSGLGAALGLGFVASLGQALVAGGLAALTAVATRSMLASVIAPLVLLAGAQLAATRVDLTTAHAEWALLPNLAAQGLREAGAKAMLDPDAVGVQLAAPGAAALLVYVVALMGLTLLVFQRQDLTDA